MHNPTAKDGHSDNRWPPQLMSRARMLQIPKPRFRVYLIALLVIIVYIWTSYRKPTRAITPRTPPIYFNTTGHLPHIPPYIWQLYLDYSPAQIAPHKEEIHTWVAMSPSYNYAILDSGGANAMMSALSKDRSKSKYVEIYYGMSRRVMAGDYLRYLLLALEGGIYSDIDTSLMKPIRDWVPEEYKAATRLIVGIEWDQRDKGPWKIEEEMQFCQWTIAAAPGHPMLWSMVDGIVDQVRELARVQKRPVAGLDFSDRDVLKITGPTGWSDQVFKSVSLAAGEVIDWRNITGLKEPRLYGDILIMPINAFGTGQEHSGSMREGSPDALVAHHFKGSWKVDWGS